LDSHLCNEEVVTEATPHYNNKSTSWKKKTAYSLEDVPLFTQPTLSHYHYQNHYIRHSGEVQSLSAHNMTSVECPQTYKEGDTQSIYQQLLVVDTYVSLIHHSDHCKTRIMKTKLLAVLSLLLIAGQLTGEENKRNLQEQYHAMAVTTNIHLFSSSHCYLQVREEC